jgi:protein phosphatase 1 regulatory subunit 3A/B/C/D/E
MGLDLAAVKTFMDEVPQVPKSAYDDLEFDHPDEEDKQKEEMGKSATSNVNAMTCQFGLFQALSPTGAKQNGPKKTSTVVLMPMFAQLGTLPNFHDLVRERNVCLERATGALGSGLRVTGVVWVRNLAFEKRVFVRWTADEWASHADAVGQYVEGDGFADRFRFEFNPPSNLKAGQRVQMCLRFEAGGVGEFWDSNCGQNYVFQCSLTTDYSRSAPSSAPRGPSSLHEDPFWHSPL